MHDEPYVMLFEEDEAEPATAGGEGSGDEDESRPSGHWDYVGEW